MKNKIGIDDTSLQKITSLFSKYPVIKEVILFGSRAKGNFREGSDIDLALKGQAINSTLLTQIELEYDKLYLPWKLDLIIHDTIQNADLKDHIQRVGISLYQRRP